MCCHYYYAVHLIVGSLLGPLRGAVFFFSFLGDPPCFFCRAAAAANRASRCRSRSSSVRVGSTRGAGRLSSLLIFRLQEAVAEDGTNGSVSVSWAAPNRWPWKTKKGNKNIRTWESHQVSIRSMTRLPCQRYCLANANHHPCLRTVPWNATGWEEFGAAWAEGVEPEFCWLPQQFPILRLLLPQDKQWRVWNNNWLYFNDDDCKIERRHVFLLIVAFRASCSNNSTCIWFVFVLNTRDESQLEVFARLEESNSHYSTYQKWKFN